jgi:hypothetical protein
VLLFCLGWYIALCLALPTPSCATLNGAGRGNGSWDTCSPNMPELPTGLVYQEDSGPAALTPASTASHFHLLHLLQSPRPTNTWKAALAGERGGGEGPFPIPEGNFRTSSSPCLLNSKPNARLRKSVECMQLIKGQVSSQTKYWKSGTGVHVPS